MLKQFAAILLLFAFSAQIFNRAAIVLDYYTNTTSFAKNCENKALPKLHCNGKCQMMKKLQEEENKDQQNPERKADNKNEVLFSSRLFSSTLELIAFEQKINFPSFVALKEKKMPKTILRPPIC